SLEQIRERYFFPPQLIREYENGAGTLYHLLGEETTPCMRVRKSVITGPIQKVEDQCFIGIVTGGEVELSTGTDHKRLMTYDKFFYPAGGGPLTINPQGPAEILECYPPLGR
ncbi:MAG TPA: hypothetical protein VK995_04985, partial [Oceanipulchritudo sp.]|nr:hypothetical protein [Oceanipulchritudo sp.]